MSLLRVENYRKSFGGNEVLKGVSFTLEKGQVLAIIGSSGGGKTTLLRCLNLLETPDSGSLYLNDELLFDASDKEKTGDKSLRKKRLHFGLVFQQFNLFPQYTVLQNVMLAQKLLAKEELREKRAAVIARQKEEMRSIKALLGKYAKRDIARLKTENKAALRELKAGTDTRIREKSEALIARVGLTDKLAAYPCEPSGGQCQRVAIARALALTPDVLCFDEPTSALDPELTGEVLKVIKGLKSGDSTMIVVTHEMEFAKNVADKVLFIADGVIEEQGTPEEVFGSPKSEKIKAFLARSREK